MQGLYRPAVRLTLKEVSEVSLTYDVPRETRAFVYFLVVDQTLRDGLLLTITTEYKAPIIAQWRATRVDDQEILRGRSRGVNDKMCWNTSWRRRWETCRSDVVSCRAGRLVKSLSVTLTGWYCVYEKFRRSVVARESSSDLISLLGDLSSCIRNNSFKCCRKVTRSMYDPTPIRYNHKYWWSERLTTCVKSTF